MQIVKPRYSTIIIRDDETLPADEYYVEVTSPGRWLTNEYSTYVTFDGIVFEAARSEFEDPRPCG
jgi:hypothetical protein